jgi:hypothetical protein
MFYDNYSLTSTPFALIGAQEVSLNKLDIRDSSACELTMAHIICRTGQNRYQAPAVKMTGGATLLKSSLALAL